MLLENGAFIETYDMGTTLGGYYYFERAGRKMVSERCFYWTDTNERFVCDEEDVCWYERELYYGGMVCQDRVVYFSDER